MATNGGNCWNCGTVLTAFDYGRGDVCRKCGRATRTCKGCVHFDPTAHNSCRETMADRVVDKEVANFCDYFKPGTPSGTGAQSRDAMKAAAEALFKKKS
ncbi:MAG: hypothetical protein JNL01_05440 [Bdellovibrionales bacterium]|nr:hypothetical protein [Bdellovibrionales bacterium]